MFRLSTLLVLLFLGTPPVFAGSPVEQVRRADAARVMATIAADADRLEPLLSERLSYGHADGRVQTKADLLDALRSSRLRYETYDYEELQITPINDEAATMSGLVRLVASAGEQRVAFRLRFLGIWRREAGGWRLFAYQSTQLPAAKN